MKIHNKQKCAKRSFNLLKIYNQIFVLDINAHNDQNIHENRTHSPTLSRGTRGLHRPGPTNKRRFFQRAGKGEIYIPTGRVRPAKEKWVFQKAGPGYKRTLLNRNYECCTKSLCTIINDTSMKFFFFFKMTIFFADNDSLKTFSIW